MIGDRDRKTAEEDFPPYDPDYCAFKKIAFAENCPCCGNILLMCKKYGGQCLRIKCRSDRERKDKNNV